MNRETYTMEIWLDVKDLGRLSSHTEPVMKHEPDGRLKITMELRFSKDEAQPFQRGSLAPWVATRVQP